MGKIYYYAVCILLLCNCNNSGVSEIGVDNPIILDSVIEININPILISDQGERPHPEESKESEPMVDNIEIIQQTHRTIEDVYTSYIGVREATGKNDGPEVEMFLKTVGLGKGYPWCAAFVKYCLLEAGVIDAERINGMALSCENKKNMIYNNRQMIGDPQSGDVFTLYYANLKRIGHTGFHHKKINNTVYESVEGNTNAAGSREGDGVYRKKRSYNATHSISRWP